MSKFKNSQINFLIIHKVIPTNVMSAIAFLFIGCASSLASAQQYQIFCRGKLVALELNAKQVAVFSNQQSELTVESLNRGGLKIISVKQHSIPGWYLMDTDLNSSREELSIQLDIISRNHGCDFVAPVFFDNLGGPFIPTRDILLRFAPQIERSVREQFLDDLKIGSILERDWANMSGAFRIRTAASDGLSVLEQANTLAQCPEILWAEPDMIFSGRGAFEPNDPLFSDCWGLNNTGQLGKCQGLSGTFDMDMDLPEAWDLTLGDEDIAVLILETGVQQDHPDLNQMPGEDFTGQGSGGAPINECENHGTSVAGCVSSIIDNGLGSVGVAPSCRSASARVFIANTDSCNGSWNAQYSWGVYALEWAESIGIRVTNNSNLYGGSSAALADKYKQTQDDGMVHFASAGNNGTSNIGYPANLDSVHAIAALNSNGNLAWFSDYGTGLAFSAPGQDIMTADRTGSVGYVNGDYVCVDGTSFASPYAAGVAALILSVNPSLDAFDVEQIMINCSVDLGDPDYDTTFGWGFVNAHQAVQLAKTIVLPGDVNLDGVVNLLDVEPFVNLISNNVYQVEGDINGDGFVSLLDVRPFVDLLTGN